MEAHGVDYQQRFLDLVNVLISMNLLPLYTTPADIPDSKVLQATVEDRYRRVISSISM